MSSATPTPNDVAKESTAASPVDSGVESSVKPEITKELNGNNTPSTEESAETKAVDVAKARKEFQEKAEAYLLEQSQHVVIPSYSKWFNFDSIHSIEQKLFPDFFPPKSNDDSFKSVYKTEVSYKNIRDFIINAYRINPNEYLTVTAIRRNLAGDVASIIRIHKFLEKWGLINYQVDPRTKSTLVGPQYTGHFQITLDTPKGLCPFIPEDVATVNTSLISPPDSSVEPEEKNESTVENPIIPLNLEIRRNVYNESAVNDTTDSIVQYFCSITGENTTEVRYHNLKSKAIANNAGLNVNNAAIISESAFEQGLFPSNFLSSDFIKLTKNIEKAKWTEQELLLLFEGIEMFATFDNQPQSLFANNNGQWDKISEYIGTKTREQCLVKFIQLPIEDRYLNKLINPEKEDVLTQHGIKKESIIQDIVEKLITTDKGKELIKDNSLKNVQEATIEQTSLINQVIELTLEKVQTKLSLVDKIEANLIKTENLLNLQRKQLLIERWLNFEKIHKFKQQNSNPELNDLLDSLLTPVSITEVNQTFNKVNLDDKNETSQDIDMDNIDSGNKDKEEDLPVSVSQPKSYQFWSA